jgi:hypothetical protein
MFALLKILFVPDFPPYDFQIVCFSCLEEQQSPTLSTFLHTFMQTCITIKFVSTAPLKVLLLSRQSDLYRMITCNSSCRVQHRCRGFVLSHNTSILLYIISD